MNFVSDIKSLIRKAEEKPEHWEPALHKIISQLKPAISSLQFLRTHSDLDHNAHVSIELSTKRPGSLKFDSSSVVIRSQKQLKGIPPGKATSLEDHRNKEEEKGRLIATKIYEHTATGFLYFLLFETKADLSQEEQGNLIKSLDDMFLALMPQIDVSMGAATEELSVTNDALWLNSLLNRNSSPALILDGRGYIQYANDPANEMLEDQSTGLHKTPQNQLGLDNKRSVKAVQAMLERVQQDPAETFTAVALTQNRGAANDILILSRLGPPVPENLWKRLFTTPPQILAVVRSGAIPIAISPELLKAPLGLTNREADIAAALANGLKVEEYAETAGVTKDTVRWHLKQILNKTGCRGQTDLVRRILYQFSLLGLY